ncbi:MAG: hypothetical protein M3Q56_05130 [Bacteroidota bacterium]|nr:hypothetical protein [Bacteroidota bacterium]
MTKPQPTYFYYLLLCICFSCSNFDPDESIPSYLYIAPIQFTTTPNEGSARQDFKDAWVYANGDYVGAYELPATIPIVYQGIVDISIIPGIRLNGSVQMPHRHGLVKEFKKTIEMHATEVDSLYPFSAYEESLKFPFIEDFDLNHFFNGEEDMNSETKLVLTNPMDAFEGTNSGLIELDSMRNYFESWYDIDRPIPLSSNPIMMEIHYKSDIPFSIGFIAFNNGNFAARHLEGRLFPNSEWTKVYFDFREILNAEFAGSYKIAIQAFYNKDISKSKQQIFIDNIKVVHR